MGGKSDSQTLHYVYSGLQKRFTDSKLHMAVTLSVLTIGINCLPIFLPGLENCFEKI